MKKDIHRKIKIVHLIDSLGKGGAERLLVTNINKLDSDSFQHYVVYLSGKNDLIVELNKDLVSVFCLGFNRKFDFFKVVLRLRSILKDIKPDIVHTNLLKSDIIGRLTAKIVGIPLVVTTLHEVPYYPEVFIDNPGLNGWKYKIIQFIEAISANLFTDQFIAVSDFTKETACKYLKLPEKRITRIYNLVDLDFLNRKSNLGLYEQLKKRLNLNKDDIILLNIARLAPQKGQKYLFKAMKGVVSRFPNAKLLIHGRGPLLSSLLEVTSSLGLRENIIFITDYFTKEEMRALLDMSDLFVFPSLYEGLGIALLEALAMQKACVVSDIPPFREIINNQENGILVEPMNIKGFASAIIDLLSDKAKKDMLAARAKSTVEQKFNLENNSNLLRRFYLKHLKK